jgi:hypothetical protein
VIHFCKSFSAKVQWIRDYKLLPAHVRSCTDPVFFDIGYQLINGIPHVKRYCTKLLWSLVLLKAFFVRMLCADEMLLFSFVPVFWFLWIPYCGSVVPSVQFSDILNLKFLDVNLILFFKGATNTIFVYWLTISLLFHFHIAFIKIFISITIICAIIKRNKQIECMLFFQYQRIITRRLHLK